MKTKAAGSKGHIKSYVNLINDISLYYIIENALSLPDSKSPYSNITVDDQWEFVKLLTAANTIISQRQKTIVIKEKGFDSVVSAAMTCLISDYDFSTQNYEEVVIAQLFRCVYFFQFAEQQLPEHLRVFHENNNINNWKDYVKFLCGLAMIFIGDKDSNIKIPQEEEYYLSYIGILDKLACYQVVDPNDFDFVAVRNQPLYKWPDGSYKVLSKIFLAEKLYKSLYFEFNGINNSLRAIGKGVSDFRSFIGLHFSEESLSYHILKQSMPKRFLKISGEDFRNRGLSGEPDYYVRNGNKVFVFESKDALFNAQIKVSYDTEKIIKEIEKKLYRSGGAPQGTSTPKAILQLLANIGRLLSTDELDEDLDADNARIFPIIVVHDRIFNAPGINWIVNKWFVEEIENNYSQYSSRIESVVIIDIETLVLIKTRLQSRQIVLEHLIPQYAKMLANTRDINKPSFRDYFRAELFNRGANLKQLLEDLKTLEIEP